MQTMLTFQPDTRKFEVDGQKRTLSGLLVPYGQVASSGGFDWSFSRGALKYADPSRVKLLRDHDTTRPVGRALALEDTEDGLYGVFSVARGAAGDEVLSLAEDDVLDGFSIGPVMSEQGFTVDKTTGVRHVSDARLAEVTVTAVPAFDDARVHRVAAMADNGKGKDVGDTTTAAAAKADEQAMEQFKAEVTAKFDAVAAGVEKSQEKLTEAFSKAVQSAFSVVKTEGGDVARYAVISEPPVYNFGGEAGAPSLVRDSWKFHVERNMEAADRLRKFEQQQQEMKAVQFANNTGNSAQVIPPGYRPDLFVGELNKGRPLNSLVSTGNISNGNPFTVPRYTSHTGAAGDHTEGTNPTSGTIVFGSTIVDPGAISGSFVITRELIDSANPAVDAIALGVMREEWARLTEQKLYAAILAGTTPAAAFTPADAVSQLRGVLADYPFTRFAAPTGAAISQLATNTLATIEDSTGRPLLPSVGAQNSAGVGNAVNQGWYVDGLPFVPAYSVAGDAGATTGQEFAEVIILNRSDVWAWESSMLTFRFEEKLGPANIELALFGYYGAAVLRPEGVVVLGGTSA